MAFQIISSLGKKNYLGTAYSLYLMTLHNNQNSHIQYSWLLYYNLPKTNTDDHVHMYYLYAEFLSKYQSSVSHQRICGLNQMKALQRKICLNYIFTDSIKFQWHGKITNFIHISNWQSRNKVWQVNLCSQSS